DGAELVDAELGVRDEAAVLALALLAQEQVAQHLLHRRVPEPGPVDEGGRLRCEEVGLEVAKGKSLESRGILVGCSAVVPVLDETEEHTERLVQVSTGLGLRGGELDEGEVAETVEAVAAFVLRG